MANVFLDFVRDVGLLFVVEKEKLTIVIGGDKKRLQPKTTQPPSDDSDVTGESDG
jgi:hypothetical protein